MPVKHVDTLAAFVPTPVADATYFALAHALNAQTTLSLQPRAECLPGAVLFADISGFTALTARLAASGADGSEEMTRLLNLYFTQVIALLKRYGGQVIKFSGDALIALFPAHAGQDSVRAMRLAVLRAVYAALAMQTATANFQHLRTSVGEVALAVKVGLGAGDVFTAHVGGVQARWEYLVAGDPLTQATHAEEQARPGDVVLSVLAADRLGLVDRQGRDYLVWQGGLQDGAGLPPPATLLAPPPPLDWSRLPARALEQARSVLRAYVPAVITLRLAVGQDAWLAELRRMTVMFVEVGGFDYQHPDVLDQLQPFMTSVQTIISRYDGSLNKLIVDDKGTVLLVLFGAPPRAHEDDPRRALACAQELQSLPARATAGGLALRMAIGVTTATVFAGPVGSPTRREYTVIGDGVNVAARLMQQAGNGGLLCDDETAALARRWWVFEQMPLLRVKGKPQPVVAYRVRDRRVLMPSGDGKSIVGRDQELAVLECCLDALDQGVGQVVSLVGAGGMGKTRLVQEVLALAQQRAMVCLCGTASGVGQQTPYLVWRGVLAGYFGLEGLSRAARRGEWLRERGLILDEELQVRLPLLNDLLDLELPETTVTRQLSPRLRRDTLVSLVVELVLRRAQQEPLLLVLEDMHDADSLSWDMLLSLARVLAAHPVLLLVSYRPGAGEDRPHVGLQRLRQHRVIHLRALEPRAVARLAANGLEGVPVAPELTDWLAEQSQGNPFFVEETVRMLREQGGLRLNEYGLWEFDRGSQLIGVAPTLKGIIQSRLDRLDPDLQFTCKVASVIGRVFSLQVLSAIYPVPVAGDQLLQHLETLAQLDITLREAAEPDLIYRFKSVQTQEVACSSLLLAQRRLLHQAIAEWYEREYAADLTPYVPLLADQYSHTEQWDRWLEYAEQAGRLAAARYATTEAITYFSQAITLLHTNPHLLAGARRTERLFQLLLARVDMYERGGNYAPQAQDLDELERLAEATGRLRYQVIMLNHRARYFQNTNDYEAAERVAGAALVLGKQLADHQLIGESLNRLACTADLRADYQQALWWGTQALTNCRLAGNAAGEAHSLGFIGSAYAELGSYDQARQHHHQALAIRRKIQDPWGEAASLHQLGNVANNLGRPREALRSYREALGIRRRIGDRAGEADSLLSIGSAYQSLGDLSVAQAYQHEALTIWQSLGNQHGEAQLLISLSAMTTIMGDFGKSLRYAAEGIDLARVLGNRQIEAYGLDQLGNAYRGLRDYEQAHARHCEAHTLARELQLRRLEAYVQHHLGEWEWEWGQRTAAVTHWAAATTIRKEIGEWEFARASQSRHAHALAVLGDLPGARELAGEVWTTWGINPPPGEHEDELREAYLALYETWRLLDQPVRAAAALAWAYQAIQDRVVRLSDPAMRHSFLTNVVINRVILAAWQETGGGEAIITGLAV